MTDKQITPQDEMAYSLYQMANRLAEQNKLLVAQNQILQKQVKENDFNLYEMTKCLQALSAQLVAQNKLLEAHLQEDLEIKKASLELGYAKFLYANARHGTTSSKYDAAWAQEKIAKDAVVATRKTPTTNLEK